MARNPSGSGTIRKKTVTRNGKQYTYWEARYTTGTDSGTGKQIQKSISGKSQKEVARKLKEVTAAVDSGIYVDSKKMTAKQWFEIWEKTYLNSVKSYTRATYKSIVDNHLIPGLGAVRLDQLDPHTIQEFINGLDLAPKTVKNIHGVLHAALRKAEHLRYVPRNAADNTELPRIERKEMHVLDEDTTAAFLNVIEGHKFEMIYKTALYCGMRQGEVLGLTWDRVDFDAGAILIDRQLQKLREPGSPYRLVPVKNDKPRIIAPAPSFMWMLRGHKNIQKFQRIKAGSLWQDKGYVFCNEIGEHLAANTVRSNFKKIVEGIGQPDLRFHDLRHSFAVAALRSGDDVKTLQGNLGHHSAAFTLDQYGHVTEQMKKDSADRMEAYFKSILKH